MMRFEIQHTFGTKTFTIEGTEPPYECLCIDSLNLEDHRSVDELAKSVYEMVGVSWELEGGLKGLREMAIIRLDDSQYRRLKSHCEEVQKSFPDLHLIIRDSKTGRWKTRGDAIRRAFLRVPQEDVERIRRDLAPLIVTEAHIAAFNNGYFEDLKENGNTLADLAMKAFLEGRITCNLLARVLLYVSCYNFKDRSPTILHLVNRDGTLNEGGIRNFWERHETTEATSRFMEMIRTLLPQEDAEFKYFSTMNPDLQAFIINAKSKSNCFAIESNGVLGFSDVSDFCGPRRDLFLPYHRLSTPEEIHRSKVFPLLIAHHDQSHRETDSRVVGQRAFWTTVGLRCLENRMLDGADFSLDRIYKHSRISTLDQILENACDLMIAKHMLSCRL